MAKKREKKDRGLVILGKNLRRAREAKNWSQERLSLQCGKHRTYVGAVERGEYNVTILTLRGMTRALGVSLVDVLAGLR